MTETLEVDFSAFLALAGNARDIVLVIDKFGTVLAVSDSALTILGYVAAEHFGRNIVEYIHEDDLAISVDLLAHAEERAGRTQTVDIRVRHANGHFVPLEILPKNLLSTMGVVVLTGRDVTDRQELERSRRSTEVQFQMLATAAPVAIFRLDRSGRCLFMNDHWTTITNQPVGRALGFGYLDAVADDDHAVLFDAHSARSAGSSAEITLIATNGRTRSAIARWTKLVDAAGHAEGWVGTVEDVTEHRALEARLSHQATHDPLTGLPNRIVLNDYLTRTITRNDRETGLAVIFIDLDQFKFVNDSLGHAAGDRLLVEVANRLRATTRPGDVLGRFCGDEFVAVVQNIVTEQDCLDVTSAIAHALAEPFSLGLSRPYVCTASIGVARCTPADSADSLARNADAAMYRAKALGRDRVEIYLPEMQAQASQRLSLEMDLRLAVDSGQLAVVYQPILATRSATMVAVEALVRWDHPVRGRLTPDMFIPIAEESGLISQVGEWVLRQACLDIGGLGVGLSVNLSGRQVQDPALAERVAVVLDETKFPADRLTLEITESVLMGDEEATAATLEQLKALGVSIAVDDFGTGYASLNYLSRFPVDCLKVDRSFVAGLTGLSGGHGEIVRAVINLAHSLGMVATAEGVEETGQLEVLETLGCENVQGYLFARPVALDALNAFVNTPFRRTGDRRAVPRR